MTTDRVFNFDQAPERRRHDSIKWNWYEEDVLPLWVADMDFEVPPGVIRAIQERLQHPTLGYTQAPPELAETIAQRMQQRYNWAVDPGSLLYFPGMVAALNMVTRAFTQMGDGVLMQTPVYGPFLTTPGNNGRYAVKADLQRVDDDPHTFHYEPDYEAFERAAADPQTTLFFLCNPHNPGGIVYTPETLARLAEICLRHDVLICADEIHSELLVGDRAHTPIAALAPEIAQQTVTLVAPTKSFNIPGEPCSIAIVPDEAKWEALFQVTRYSGLHASALSYAAALGAYRDSADWQRELLAYLRDNRDYARAFIREHMPMLKTTHPEGTFLLWIDCSALPLPADQSAQAFFLEQARVACNPGDFFGRGYERYVRLNFGCPRDTLRQALTRMADAIRSPGQAGTER